MTMSGSRLSRFAVLASLTLASLVAAHELIYLASHGAGAGYETAMRERGHDRYWTSFVLVVLAVSICLVGVATTQLVRLHRLAARRRLGHLDVENSGVDQYARLLASLWMRLALLTSFGYLFQENLETLAMSGSLPGLGVVTGEHALALPILVAVSLVVAAVGALVRWRRSILLARLRQRIGNRPRAVATLRRPAVALRPYRRSEGRRNGVRAPPTVLPHRA